MKLMNRIRLLTIASMVFGVSCNYESNKVSVENLSGTTIDSIKVVGNLYCDTLVLKDIKSSKTKVGFLRNCENGEKSGDGSYQVFIYYGSIKKTSGFGYFTNGVMSFEEAQMKFTEQKDLVIKFD